MKTFNFIMMIVFWAAIAIDFAMATDYGQKKEWGIVCFLMLLVLMMLPSTVRFTTTVMKDL